MVELVGSGWFPEGGRTLRSTLPIHAQGHRSWINSVQSSRRLYEVMSLGQLQGGLVYRLLTLNLAHPGLAPCQWWYVRFPLGTKGGIAYSP